LGDRGIAGADVYLATARRNLEDFALGRLWDPTTGTFRDSVEGLTFVPNKAATFVEAVSLLQELTGATGLLERYAIPTGTRILELQVRRPGDYLDGAIAQNRFGQRVVESYFPIYVARCIPALLQLTAQTREPRFRDGALAAVAFLARVREPDGGFPMVLYPAGRRNRFPRWVAGTGDVVRAFDLAREAGAMVDSTATICWLVNGTRQDGRVITADGFGKIVPWISRRERVLGELGVVGWCDKAFRALAAHADPGALVPRDPSVTNGKATQPVEPRGVVR
jgi:hypothetical protein